MDRPIIIAEIGINHNGDMDLALNMIDMAAGCGADVAKFQLYDPETLLNPGDFSGEDWSAVVSSELSADQAWLLKECCDDEGVEFLASAFDLERLGWLEALDVRMHKIASRSVYDAGYCEAVIKTGKPYLVSDGWMKRFGRDNPRNESYWETYHRLKTDDGRGLFLRCVSEYPTPLGNVKIDRDCFARQYRGFSDHTVGTSAAITALAWGAMIVEKHFTLDKGLPGPDQACSAMPKELREICCYRDDLYEMMG